MRSRISMAERGPHPDGAVPYLDRANRNVVRPQVERAAAFKIKASVVPMTGQDTVLDAAAFERKTHVRTTIVERSSFAQSARPSQRRDSCADVLCAAMTPVNV